MIRPSCEIIIMNDLISRQAAIDYINRAIPNWSDDKETALDCLENTPAVQERKKGRWIHKVRRFATHWGCSVCGNMWFFDCSTWAFCPKCGAKMEGAEDEQNSGKYFTEC